MWRLDLRTGEYRRLIESRGGQQHPQYSPDGRRIALQSDRSGRGALLVCEADGENCQEITSLAGNVGGTPRWSPDGRWLAFDFHAEGNSQIYVIPAEGGPQRSVTSGNSDNVRFRAGHATGVGFISSRIDLASGAFGRRRPAVGTPCK